MTTSTNQPTPLDAARELAPWIRSAADQIDAQRALPRDLVNAMADAGLFRLLVPLTLGGSELDPPTYIQVVEEVAKADASTAWCVNQGAVLATNAAFLSEAVARPIWGDDPRGILANGPSPTAEATVVEGGYEVTGHWTFSSGCNHATWLAGTAVIVENGARQSLDNGAPKTRHILFPKSAAKIIDAWNVHGLRGTGSYHFSVDKLFVPTECSVWTYTDPARESGPLYLYPIFLLFGSGFASVALGVARSALDTMIEIAGGKQARGEQDLLRAQTMVQSQVGQAEATWRSARAYLHQTVQDVWADVSTTHVMTIEHRAHLRLAITHTIRQAAQTVDIAYNTSGVNAIYAESPLQRHFQDIHVITQHIQGRLSHYEAPGQYFLGLEPSTQWL